MMKVLPEGVTFTPAITVAEFHYEGDWERLTDEEYEWDYRMDIEYPTRRYRSIDRATLATIMRAVVKKRYRGRSGCILLKDTIGQRIGRVDINNNGRSTITWN